MKRKLTAVTAALLAATMLASCSAYSNPSKYITLPSLSEITVSKADIEKEKKEQISTNAIGFQAQQEEDDESE